MRSNSYLGTVLAFASPLWGRNKGLYGTGAIILLLLSFATHDAHRRLAESPLLPMMRDGALMAFSIIYCSFSVLLAATAIGFHPFGILGRPIGNDSTYPRNWFTLPVSTQALVWIPTLLSMVIFSAFWTPFALTTVMPLGLSIPPALPFLTAFAFLGVLQAVWWCGGWLPFIFGLMPLPMLVLACDSFLSFKHHPEPVRSVVLAIETIVSIVLASWVAPRSRNGAKPPLPPIAQMIPNRARGLAQLRPFRSPNSAQFWYECGPSRMSLLLPVGMVTLILVFATFLVAAFVTAVTVPMPTDVDYILWPIGIWGIRSDFGFFGNLAPDVVLLIAAMGPNGGFGDALKGRTPYKRDPLNGFLLTRPVSTASIVAVRLRIALVSAVAISPLLILPFALSLGLPASEGGRYVASRLIGGQKGTIGELIAGHLGDRAQWVALLLVICVPLFCFSLQGGNPLLNTKWRWAGLPLVFAAIFAVGSVSILLNTSRFFPHSEDVAFHALYLFAWVWLAGKLALGSYAVSRVARQGLLSKRTLRISVGLWVTLFLLLTAAFYVLLPTGTIALSTLTLTIAILLPANRFLWLVLNLDSTRHA